MILLDTSAWIEFFNGSESGKRVKQLLASEASYTSAISIAEVAKWAKQNGKDVEAYNEALKTNSQIISLEEYILKEAGIKYLELRKISKDIGMIDVIIYTTAQLHGLELITHDSDFKNLNGVKML
ncbi:MAG: PIN domain-containing protein [Candidatus Micrarchaeota archaeon]|nr:PIN domain-containing protein [Candidatus Micrarchaeota archaeon]